MAVGRSVVKHLNIVTKVALRGPQKVQANLPSTACSEKVNTMEGFQKNVIVVINYIYQYHHLLVLLYYQQLLLVFEFCLYPFQ